MINPAVDSTKPSRDPIETAIRIGLIAALLWACLRIVAPFGTVLLWSALLAVLLYPLHARLRRRVGNRWSATIIGLVGVGLLLMPLIFAANAIADSAYELAQGLQAKTLSVGPPPTNLVKLPIIGAKLSEVWETAHADLPAAMTQFSPVIKPTIAKLAGFAGGMAASLLSFVASLAIAAILIAYGDRLVGLITDIAARVSGSRARADRQLVLTKATIRSVALGVVGVAVVQAILVGIGLFAVSLPFAALITLVVLLLAIVQVPAIIVTLPVIVYVFTTADTTTAIVFAVWMVVAGLSDNFLKPLLLGRGVEVPMPVILIGVIGGMVVDGLVGLFLGPVLLAIFWVLLIEWIRPEEAIAAAKTVK